MTHQQPDMLADLPGDGLPARAAALDILTQVLGQKKMLDSVLERAEPFRALPPRDRAFVRMMAATALRRKGQLDDLIARTMAKGEAPRPESLRYILYLGITQILFMDVANHAAVDTSVRLAAQSGLESKKGFVNAVLRRIAGEEGRQWLSEQDEAALNIPAWLYGQWMTSYGAVRAKDIALASLGEAALDITLKDPAKAQEWAERLGASVLPTGSLRKTDGGLVTEFDGFEGGDWWVQDASSAIPARLFGDIKGKTVLDLCAAPGGKTMQLAAMGANVVALDRSASRMAHLTENLKRTGLSERVQTIVEDGAHWRPREKFHYVLMDAPCTATGTLRRHPDLLSLKNERDQNGLCDIQERLLLNALSLVEVGGILIYCTCSLQKQEGEEMIDAFLQSYTSFARIPVRKEGFSGIDGAINSEGDIRILPYHLKELGGMDGFFISRMQRVS